MVDRSVSRVRRWLVLAAAVAVVAAGCGGGDETGGTDEPATQAPSSPGATSAPSGGGETGGGESGGGVEGAVQPQTFDVNQHFWHSGFRVEVTSGELSFEENALTGRVTNLLALSATLENLSADEGFFGPDVVVTTANNSYPAAINSDVPDVPGGLKSQATFAFLVDGDFDLSTAELVVGRADVNRAVVPLSGGGDAVRLEPSELDVSGTLSMELIDFVFTSGELRYDIVPRRRQVEAGKQALTLYFDAVSRKGGNWQVFPDNLALVTPDGTAIGADAVEIGSLPGSDDGTTTPDRSVRFLVDEMPSGSFVIRLTPGNWFVGDDGVTEATFEFTLP